MCADNIVSPGDLGIPHYPCKRSRYLLAKATDRNLLALYHHKVYYDGNGTSAA